MSIASYPDFVLTSMFCKNTVAPEISIELKFLDTVSIVILFSFTENELASIVSGWVYG
jgi:hypothetical protein